MIHSSKDSEKEWQLMSDCRVLADYQEIVSDPKRYKAALDHAEKMIEKKQAEIDNLKYMIKEGKES